MNTATPAQEAPTAHSQVPMQPPKGRKYAILLIATIIVLFLGFVFWQLQENDTNESPTSLLPQEQSVQLPTIDFSDTSAEELIELIQSQTFAHIDFQEPIQGVFEWNIDEETTLSIEGLILNGNAKNESDVHPVSAALEVFGGIGMKRNLANYDERTLFGYQAENNVCVLKNIGAATSVSCGQILPNQQATDEVISFATTLSEIQVLDPSFELVEEDVERTITVLDPSEGELTRIATGKMLVVNQNGENVKPKLQNYFASNGFVEDDAYLSASDATSVKLILKGNVACIQEEYIPYEEGTILSTVTVFCGEFTSS
jgi:hypothetical protein